MTAIVLLLAAKAIEQQADRLVRLAHDIEQQEARS
jgi:HAMP domain-containing protein